MTAACEGLDPRRHFEDAWNDGTSTPAPGLALAVADCAGCTEQYVCWWQSTGERFGVWAGTTPADRGFGPTRSLRLSSPEAHENILAILDRTGYSPSMVTNTAAAVIVDGRIRFTLEDFPPDTPLAPGAPSVEQIDAEYKAAWDAAAAEYGDKFAIPAEVRTRLMEDHRQAHIRRLASSPAAPAGATDGAADAAGRVSPDTRWKRQQRMECRNGHNLTVNVDNGKPALTATGKCRRCIKEYDEARKAAGITK
jgi:hypothetical protein